MAMKNYDLYPEIQPFESGMLLLDERHAMYWEQSGNPDGVPVVFLHGGPGAGTVPIHRRFFDPGHYRIILFDQRGAGRSTPFADVTDNTTAHLVADIERLRHSLGIEAWVVFGGSWGAALALAYGAAFTERCLGFVLRGIFLGRQREIDWFLHEMGTFFPEAWRAFAHFLPPMEREDLLGNYHRRLIDPNPLVHLPAARAWSGYETACSTLLPRSEPVIGNDRMSLSLARIEAHYFLHNTFLGPDQLLGGVAALRKKPAVIVQGRYDVVCPIASAYELARAWPEADYVVVPDAGHSAMEPGIRVALVAAMDRMKQWL